MKYHEHPLFYPLDKFHQDILREEGLEISTVYQKPLNSMDFMTDGNAEAPLESVTIKINDLCEFSVVSTKEDGNPAMALLFVGFYSDYTHPTQMCPTTTLCKFAIHDCRSLQVAISRIVAEMKELITKANRIYALTKRLQFLCPKGRLNRVQVIDRLSKYLIDNYLFCPNGDILNDGDRNLRRLFGKKNQTITVRSSFDSLSANMLPV